MEVDSVRILIEHGKHATSYYLVDTLERLDKAALSILRMRHEMGYIYEPEEPYNFDKEAYELTDEQLDAIPIESVRADLTKRRERAQRTLKESEVELREYNELLELLDQDSTIYSREVTVRENGQYVKKPGKASKAWEILRDRGDYEYERVELETVTAP